MPRDTYTHGHHASVLRSHSWRTAENSAAYLLPGLRPDQHLLDLGCGPGTLTLDLAERVAPGEVLGIDVVEDVLEIARANAQERGIQNVRFIGGDLYDLRTSGVEDASFDVVHMHQVLQHLSNPGAAMREARRVLAPGGIFAARESLYSSKTWAPDDPILDRWLEIYLQVARRNQGEPDAGRYLMPWAMEAGFTDVKATTSNWTFADPESRSWWGESWAERMEASSLAVQAVEYGYSTTDELAQIADAWLRWSRKPDAFFMVPLGEIIARSVPA